MPTATDLIQYLDQAREKMRRVQAGVDEHRLIYPGWTIKHVLAHIAGWDDETRSALTAHITQAVYVTPALDADSYNAISVAERENLTYAQVVREWEASREQLKAELANLPPEKLAEHLLFPWGETGTLTELYEGLAQHEAGHARIIEQILERQKPADSQAAASQ
jgi:hypothetical protein